MTEESFPAVERRIRASQGEQFFTRSGLPMTYVVEGDRIRVSRAKPWLSMEGAKELWGMGPSATLTETTWVIHPRRLVVSMIPLARMSFDGRQLYPW
jgi:hypothetical protein